jgi:hypothetical protein
MGHSLVAGTLLCLWFPLLLGRASGGVRGRHQPAAHRHHAIPGAL